jgi:hypothetical protein
MRSVDYYIGRAKEVGEATARFMTNLLSGDFPWANLRQAQRLLRVAEKYGSHRLEPVCTRALSFGLESVKRLETMIRKGLAQEDSSQPMGKLISMEKARFARDASYFCHAITPVKEGHSGNTQ